MYKNIYDRIGNIERGLEFDLNFQEVRSLDLRSRRVRVSEKSCQGLD